MVISKSSGDKITTRNELADIQLDIDGRKNPSVRL